VNFESIKKFFYFTIQPQASVAKERQVTVNISISAPSQEPARSYSAEWFVDAL